MIKKQQAQEVVMHTFDPSPWEAETDGSFWVQSQLDRQGYIEKPCLEKTKKNQTNKTKPWKLYKALIASMLLMSPIVGLYAKKTPTKLWS